MIIEVEVKHRIGDIVYLVTDPDQQERMITGFIVRESGRVLYDLSMSTQSSWHSGGEVCDEKNVLKSIL